MLWGLVYFINSFYGFRYYTVQYTESNSGWQTIQEKIDYSSNSYSARNLKPFTSYKFRLQATNDIGASGWSENSEDVRTLPAAPIEPPTDIKVWKHFSFNIKEECQMCYIQSVFVLWKYMTYAVIHLTGLYQQQWQCIVEKWSYYPDLRDPFWPQTLDIQPDNKTWESC